MEKLSRSGKRAWERLFENRRKAGRLAKQMNRLNKERDKLRDQLSAAFSGEKEVQLARHKTLTLEIITVEEHTVPTYAYPVFKEVEEVSD